MLDRLKLLEFFFVMIGRFKRAKFVSISWHWSASTRFSLFIPFTGFRTVGQTGVGMRLKRKYRFFPVCTVILRAVAVKIKDVNKKGQRFRGTGLWLKFGPWIWHRNFPPNFLHIKIFLAEQKILCVRKQFFSQNSQLK